MSKICIFCIILSSLLLSLTDSRYIDFERKKFEFNRGYLNSIISEVKSQPRKIVMDASFYSPEETNNQLPATGVRGATLSQALSGKGLLQVAVDPAVIPLNSEFNIALWDGRTVKAKALDTGSAIKGNVIDIYTDSVKEAINLGRKVVTAYVRSY